MKKRELVPALIAAAAAVISIMVIMNLPSVKLFIIDLRITVIAGLGFLVVKNPALKCGACGGVLEHAQKRCMLTAH